MHNTINRLFLCRVRILAELHWALPRPLSRAELRLRDHALPEAEAARRELQHAAQARALPCCASFPHRWRTCCM